MVRLEVKIEVEPKYINWFVLEILQGEKKVNERQKKGIFKLK